MWLRNALTFVQLLSAAGIIGLVLLQRGKGADAGAGFGAGASGTVFGARGATTALSRATAIIAAIFMINSLVLAYLGTRTDGAAAAHDSRRGRDAEGAGRAGQRDARADATTGVRAGAVTGRARTEVSTARSRKSFHIADVVELVDTLA